MPTEQVIEKLEKLQKELETISNAVKHIDEAAKVARAAAEILKKIPELINDLKALEVKHFENLLKIHKEKIVQLERLLNILLTTLNDKSEVLSQHINETINLEKAISDYLAEIKSINFPERLDKIDNQITAINIGVANLQTSVNAQSHLVDKKFSVIDTKLNVTIFIGVIVIIGIILIFILYHK